MTTTNATPDQFQAKLDSFVEGVQAIVVEAYKKYPSLTPNRITADPNGRRYIRIVTTTQDRGPGSDGQRSVWGFVDTTNGDILKAEGWKKPAKHARGNIFDANPFANVNEHGPNYLR